MPPKKEKEYEYEMSLDYKEKVAKFDKYVLAKKKQNSNNKYVTDDIISMYLIENDLLKHECKKCNQSAIWQGKPLTMILDRINNIIDDNRLSNLRFMCPNCFIQAKKRKTLFNRVVKDKERLCIDCGKRIKNGSSRQDDMKCTKQRCKACLTKLIDVDVDIPIKSV